MNRSVLIQQVQNWKSEWNRSVESAQEAGDLKAAEKLKVLKPDFELLIHSLDDKAMPTVRQAGQVQEELWQEGSGASNMLEIVRKLKQKIAKLSLPTNKRRF